MSAHDHEKHEGGACCHHHETPKVSEKTSRHDTAAKEASCCHGKPDKAEAPSCHGGSSAEETPSCHSGGGHDHGGGSCHVETGKTDWLLWGSAIFVALGVALSFLPDGSLPPFVHHYAVGVTELMERMWWGVLIGMVMVGLLAKVPRDFVIAILGQGGSKRGLVRAVLAGVLLDLCNHGILMVGAKLYERGASYGQVVAFLVASPWNSFSLTLVLIALVGFKLTLAFILLSMMIALVTGYIFDLLERRGMLAPNPNAAPQTDGFRFWPAAIGGIKATRFDGAFFRDVARHGINDSRMVIRWILFGVVLAVVVRMLVDADVFAAYFGPTLMGLLATIGAATLIEVCSEGSTPLAADLVTRAHAPGNAFAFLMTGVATDYTEIMVLKSATGRWLNALLLPVITVPQVLLISMLING